METIKKIAVYMDNFTANVIEYTTAASELVTITSDFNRFEKEKIIQNGESPLYNKEQDLQLKYYKEISDVVFNYSTVLLFGPTTAKTELQAILANENRFSGVVTIKITEKLTPNEQLAFVDDCFYIDQD